MSSLERYLAAGREAGCLPGQMENFVRAGIVLQPRQLAASAAARLCDRADGPTAIGYGGARGGGKSHWLLAQMGADDCQRVPGLNENAPLAMSRWGDGVAVPPNFAAASRPRLVQCAARAVRCGPISVGLPSEPTRGHRAGSVGGSGVMFVARVGAGLTPSPARSDAPREYSSPSQP